MRTEALRALVLEEWRGLPEGDGKPERCVRVCDALAKLLPKLGLADRLNEEQVRTAWSEIVGEFLAAHSSPAGMQRGILTIEVLQPSVRYELERQWKPVVLQKLKARFGDSVIKGIRFR